MSETTAPVIYDVAGAASRALVTDAVILQWIREGLKATPVGRVGRRGPKHYRIFDSWLVDFMERRAVEARQAAPAEPAPRRRGRPTAVAAGSDPLGPCPKPKGKGAAK